MTTDDWPARRAALRGLLDDGHWHVVPSWAGAGDYTIKAATSDGYLRIVTKLRDHEDAHAIVALRAALPRLLADSERAEKVEAALRHIRDVAGLVCEEYETCRHRACASSHRAWELATAALEGGDGDGNG